MQAGPRHLLNEDGGTFSDEIDVVTQALAGLPNEDRVRYRNDNAADIAQTQAPRCLVVSGPGSGKSFLFLGRIRHWLSQEKTPDIHVSSFVRKLVNDLQADVETKIERELQQHVTVTTLHALARSLIERNGGTSDLGLAAHVAVIGQQWERLVWDDVLAFHSEMNGNEYSWHAIQQQLYDDALSDTDQWLSVRATFDMLRIFYNAVGFADMIVTARIAVQENPDLITRSHWIFDEYQDFNTAEDRLVKTVTAGATAVLFAGDDDQALYQQLKGSHPEIIKSYYEHAGFAKAMLPYCSRCTYYVCLAASAFIDQHRESDGIAKIYLPLVQDPSAPKVQVVAASAPSSAVDYIANFIETHREELKAHRAAMQAGDETDAYLMILGPERKVGYYKLNGADEELHGLVAEWSDPASDHSAGYWTIADYYSAAHNTTDNLGFRKVLNHEGVSVETAHELIVRALDEGTRLAEVANAVTATAIEHCDRVAEILDSEDLTSEEKAEQCAQIVAVGDVGRLAEEFAADPIASATDEGDDSIGADASAQPFSCSRSLAPRACRPNTSSCLAAIASISRVPRPWRSTSRCRALANLSTWSWPPRPAGRRRHTTSCSICPRIAVSTGCTRRPANQKSLAGKAAFEKKLATWARFAGKGK